MHDEQRVAQRERHRAWREANREKLRAYTREYQRKYREANPQPTKTDRRRGSVRHPYGVSPEQKQQMLHAQGGLCAICRQSFDLQNIDHCHATGKVRGLLCRHCNLGLGHFKDDVARMQAAIDYLRRS
jgi:hypothetical protein